MEKTYIKNLSLICLIMILIHLAGLSYQFITKASMLAIILKLLYISMFGIFLFSLIKKKNYSYIIGIAMSCIIILISTIYMDFLSVVIALLVIYYSYNLKAYYKESYLEVIPKLKEKIKRKKTIKTKRNITKKNKVKNTTKKK